MQHDETIQEGKIRHRCAHVRNVWFFFITFLSLKDLPKTGDHDARTYIHNNDIIPQYPTYAMCDH